MDEGESVRDAPEQWLLTLESLEGLGWQVAGAPRVSDSKGLGWELKIGISHKFPIPVR